MLSSSHRPWRQINVLIQATSSLFQPCMSGYWSMDSACVCAVFSKSHEQSAVQLNFIFSSTNRWLFFIDPPHPMAFLLGKKSQGGGKGQPPQPSFLSTCSKRVSRLGLFSWKQLVEWSWQVDRAGRWGVGWGSPTSPGVQWHLIVQDLVSPPVCRWRDSSNTP